MQRGTPGYCPVRPNLKDGSTRWDLWSLAAMILEADMKPGEYMAIQTERGAIAQGEDHAKQPETCTNLHRLLNHTMFRAETGQMEGLEFIKR
jgi:hypothetical protein